MPAFELDRLGDAHRVRRHAPPRASSRGLARLVCWAALAGVAACGGVAPSVVSRPDATVDDASAVDAGLAADAAPADASSPDAGAVDASTPDASAPDASWQLPERALCAGRYRLERATARLAGADLVEVSGVVASPSNAGVLWMHNDSGDDARLFAVAVDGTRLGELLLPEVPGVDLEDLAAAPCPDGSGPCLWVADTGDNARERTDVAVYAVPEPVVSVAAPLVDAVAGTTWAFPLSYPGGPVDVEAVFVAPDGSAIYLVEKAEGPDVRLFRAPAISAGVSVEATGIARFLAPGIAVERGRMITGADLHPSGRALALRVYTGVFEYRLAGLQDLERLDALTPVTVALGPLTEPQGEAVAYDESGLGLWTVSEDPERVGDQPLNHHACE